MPLECTLPPRCSLRVMYELVKSLSDASVLAIRLSSGSDVPSRLGWRIFLLGS
jgi:hypothetical protein